MNALMKTSPTKGRDLRRAALGTALCVAGLSPLAQAADGGGWEWMVAPYGWAVSIGTDLERGVPPAGGISNDTGFDDIVDKIDGAFQLHVEGQGEHLGMFTDFTFLGLADSNDHPRFHTEADLDTRLFELAAVWSPGEGRYRGWDLFAGLRYIDVDLTVRFDPENPQFESTTFDGGDSFSDLMVGARYTWALSDRWGVTLRGDGSFGDTEGTWNASVVGTYRMKHGAWLFGYRYLSAEFETGDSSTEITLNGPMVGYGFMF
ncbi:MULTISPECIES: hypothetical protein [unclassified Luteimonas]